MRMELEKIQFKNLSLYWKPRFLEFCEKLTKETKMQWGLMNDPIHITNLIFAYRDEGIILIGVYNKEIVCHGHLIPVLSTGLIEGVVVRSDLQGQGIGTLLINKLEEEARKMKLTSLKLEVFKTNPRGFKFYEKLGYVKTGETDIDFEMRKKLK